MTLPRTSVTRFLGRGPRALGVRRRRYYSFPAATAELGTVQPLIAEIDDDGQRSVGLVLERANVSVEARVSDPRALHGALGRAIAWQEGDDDA